MSIPGMSSHSSHSHRKRQYSLNQRRRCTQIINVIVGDGSQSDGTNNKDLVEGISTIGPPTPYAIDAPSMDPVDVQFGTISPFTPLRRTSGKSILVTTESVNSADIPSEFISPHASLHRAPEKRISITSESVDPIDIRSDTISPLTSLHRAPGKRISLTYDGASVRSQSSIPNHLHPSSASSGASRPGLSIRSVSRTGESLRSSSSLLSSRQSSSYQSIGADPPRQPKDGYEWVWFPEGYWAEREIAGFVTMSKWARRAANESAASVSSSDVGPGMPGTARSEQSSIWVDPATGSPKDMGEKKHIRPKLSRRASVSTSRSIKDTVVGKLSHISPFKAADGSPEGLYCKTMRVLGGEGNRRKRTDNDSEVTVQAIATPTPTKETLNGTTNYFSQFRRKKTSEPTSKEGKSPEEETLSTKRKRLGIAPWHRKASDVSAVWSATSSLKGLLMGKTPMTSPHMEKIQQESEQYFQVDVSPGHEATPLTTPALAGVTPLYMELGAGTPLVQSIRRVNTPPLVMEPGGKARGFFFDLTPPASDARQNESRSSFDFNSRSSSSHQSNNSKQSSKPTTPSHTFMVSSFTSSGMNPHTTRPYTSKPSTPNGGTISRQWWDGDEDTIVSRAERRPITRGSFVLDIPEHLPSSPLCPMHPKHKSGGKGICPFHGRKKTDLGEGKGLGGARMIMAGFRS